MRPDESARVGGSPAGRAVAISALVLTVTLGVAPAFAQAEDEAPAPSEIDWAAVRQEAAELLSRYIQVNTANPPGNEIAAARFLRDVLMGEGIEFLLIDADAPGKAALLGRLRAEREPRRGSVILLNHMDVVDAEPDHWSEGPFEGDIRDGYVWGRGTLDMKGMAVAQLMALLLLERHGPPLDRDIVFLATSDAEVMGGADAGWFVDGYPDLISGAEFVINEGGTIRLDEAANLRYYGIGVTEKSPFWLRITARGPSGHGSRPIESSAVNRLIRALERIRTWETEPRVTPTAAAFFRGLADAVPTAEADLYREVEASLADSTARTQILNDPQFNGMLRNTVSITVLEGSTKTNVIPARAGAELDVRLLPGTGPDEFLAELERRAGIDGDSLEIEPIGATWPATSSAQNTELYRAIRAAARQLDPGAAVLPYMPTEFSDSHYFREIGIASYGLGLFRLPPSESERIHGNDERVSLDNLEFGTRFLYDILRRIGT